MKKNIKTAKGRKISSTRWLSRHINDRFVKKAHAENYRSRAAYKLIEIQDKFRIFRNDYKVLDLGAVPGGWSQVATKYVGSNGKIYAIDRIEMDHIQNVEFIKFDLNDDLEKLEQHFGNMKFDAIISDIAPNTCGSNVTDSIRSIELNKIVIDIADKFLSPKGKLIIKMFHGVEEENFVKCLKANFKSVKYFKPLASRKESKEIYLIISRA